jgi:hypothetical protein
MARQPFHYLLFANNCFLHTTRAAFVNAGDTGYGVGPFTFSFAAANMDFDKVKKKRTVDRILSSTVSPYS